MKVYHFPVLSMKERILNFANKNKVYVGIVFVFIVWMLFFDEFNWIRLGKDRHKVKQLNKEAVFLEEKIAKDMARIKALKTDPNELERFAREEYYMKKANEDIFIILGDDEK